MPNTQIVTEFGISPIESLEGYIVAAGSSLVRATFEHSYFVDPERVRERTPYYPDRARFSGTHYPQLNMGDYANWSGDGRRVRLDANHRPQIAWEGYTRMPIQKKSGYGLRHIWGHPWDPDAFTAGWNLCYMPFWAGELTEDQHPHPDLVQAMRQASWDLYFRDNPVCEPPAFVQDPGIDLDSILGSQPLRIMHRESSRSGGRGQTTSSSIVGAEAGAFDHVKAFRRKTNQSWVNIYKGARFLQNKEHKPFNSKNTESSAKSCVRKICKEVDLSYAEIEELLVEHGLVEQQK